MQSSSSFNPNVYMDHLSPFGQKVLKTMIKQWTNSTIDSRIKHRQYVVPKVRREKILTFYGSDGTINDNSVHARKLNDFQSQDINEQMNRTIASVSDGLLEPTVTVNTFGVSSDIVKDLDSSKNNVLFPTRPLSILDDTYSPENDDSSTHNNKHFNMSDSNKLINKIDWDDMFDSEIIPELNSNVQNIGSVDITTVEHKKIKKNKCLKRESSMDTGETNPITSTKRNRSVRRANKQPEVAGSIERNVKTLIDTDTIKGSYFRKQNYNKSKSIKNWLENVATYNEITKTKQVHNIMKQTNNENKKNENFNIIYNSTICTDGGNFDLSTDNIKDITLTLLYSNGSSQLNPHHTNNSGQPEGLMMYVHYCQKYFYWNRTDLEMNGQVKDSIKAAIKKTNTITCFDGKYIIIYFVQYLNLGYDDLKMNFLDAKIGGGLVNPDADVLNLTDLQNVISYIPDPVDTLTECPLQRAAYQITVLYECMERLKTMLTDYELWNLFVDIEMPLLPIIANMEFRGIQVNEDILKSMDTILLKEMKTVEQNCYKAAGKIFLINSTVQVRNILYSELKLDSITNVKIKETLNKGDKSTSEPMLRRLASRSAHPLPKLILQYRHLHKARSTFATGIAQHVHNGVVKPNWMQNAAATGRIAAKNPNLQAIPKGPFAITLFPEHNETGELRFRSAYVARPGYTLLAADFRHIECRIYAHLAGDHNLMDILTQGDDFFQSLADKWLCKSSRDLVSAEDRERCKRIVYANLYGAGTRSLMDLLHMTYGQTLAILTSFNRAFPSLKSFGAGVVSGCVEHAGRVRTVHGRLRTLPDILGPDGPARAHAERQAVNFVVQGTAADLCKAAAVVTRSELAAHRPPVDGHLLLQIHDELVWEIADGHLDAAADIIKVAMESCGRSRGLGPLPVSVTRGPHWGAMTPVTPAPR